MGEQGPVLRLSSSDNILGALAGNWIPSGIARTEATPLRDVSIADDGFT